MGYATPADFITFFNETLVEDLASDSGVPEDATTSARIQACLDAASGRIEAALVTGGRYRVEDLNNLSGNSRWYLKWLVCAIALGYLVFNRLAKLDEGTKAIIEQAEKQLDLLNKGVNIFNLPDKIEATKIDVEGPTLAERVALNTLPLRTRNFYPSEGQRLPLFRGGGSDG